MRHKDLQNVIEARLASMDNSPSEPWIKSNVPYQGFGRTSNPSTSTAFAVGVLKSDPAGTGDRQQSRDGMWLETEIAVKLAYRLAPTSQDASEERAWQAVDKAISKLLERDSGWSAGINVKFDTVSAAIVPSGEYMIADIKFTIGHLFPISSAFSV
jgi:hypothetical protein